LGHDRQAAVNMLHIFLNGLVFNQTVFILLIVNGSQARRKKGVNNFWSGK
jgi:hypothetical protein